MGGIASILAAGSYALRQHANARVTKTRTEQIEAETIAAAEERVTGMLLSMRADLDAAGVRLDDCNKRHEDERQERRRAEREGREREYACEARAREAFARIAELSLRMNKLTPMPMPKVTGGKP
jgi:hypothetical protein